jgi:glycosyl transferase family 25
LSAVPENLGVWLINLPKDSDRRKTMMSQLTKLGIEATLIEAVNGKERADELAQRVDSTAYARNMGQPLLPGKMGVYASHVGVWEAFLASDKEVALILEDDVVFHDDFLRALETALSERSRWDLIRFNCIRAKMPVSQGTKNGYSFNAYIGPFTGNACYLITRELAAKLLPNIWPQTRAMDHELNRFFRHDYRQIGLEPFASHPDDGGVSTITGADFNKVKKPHWTKRLPHFRLKAANYLRRFWWLFRNRMLF